ncbi:hypothetical protein HPO96_14210 [Kribbella sandramycini]|uniref:Uncharacterized protein n=1 Tax=Kribbella sandramycini TaxID=60450 RepID=A0A7Y4L0P4_9ACTN|nr:hypothetical protein [Kribbella sandramycini]MBB6565128.1 hypothetical protein [Kribbella sandramycini]NOL41397.1 hypothetical protein [Kribbella sandramycini]
MRRSGLRRHLLRTLFVAVAGLLACAGAAPASAAVTPKVVVIGVPGLTWADVQASPELTALIGKADVGSITVKTAGPHTCPVDGWLTLSAGTRAWASDPDRPCELPQVTDGKIPGWQSYVDLQSERHTDALLGRLADEESRVCGFGPGAALAVAKKDGSVANWFPTFDPAKVVGSDCAHAIVDAGAMPPREGRKEARQKVAGLVEQAMATDSRVLLVGVGQELANAHQQLLVAMRFPTDDGGRWLTSDSTRRPKLIQLTDVTATVLPAVSLDGSPVRVDGDRHGDAAAVIEERLDTNQRFEQPRPMLVAVSMTILVLELLAVAWFWLRRTPRSRTAATFALLTQAGFFIAVFLSTITLWWRWPAPGFSLYCVVLGISALIAGLAQVVLKRYAFLGIALVAYVILLIDGVLGTPLQFGSMFTDGPVIGGRFYGFGNSTFATLAVAALVVAGWAAQRLVDKSRMQAALAVLAIGGAAIVVDGRPGWGTDFGGIIALTPAVLLLAWLTWRGSISFRALVGVGAAGVLAVTGVAYLDYLRPASERSHFGTFFARLLDGDAADVLIRKLQMAMQFFYGVAGWAMLAGVVVAMLATVLPGRVPFPAYRAFYSSLPMIRPALLALSTCGLVGMLLNDAGVALPAIMTGFAVPLLVAHLLASPVTVSPESHLVQESHRVD